MSLSFGRTATFLDECYLLTKLSKTYSQIDVVNVNLGMWYWALCFFEQLGPNVKELFRLVEDFVEVISLRMKDFQDTYEVTDNLGQWRFVSMHSVKSAIQLKWISTLGD